MRKTQTLIQHLGLMPHPEGGWYRELHRSPEQVQRQDGAERSALTAILFLLPAGAVSCWPRQHQSHHAHRWHQGHGNRRAGHGTQGAGVDLPVSRDGTCRQGDS